MSLLRSFGSLLVLKLQRCRPAGAGIAKGARLSYAMRMKCPACKSELREKGAGGMTVDICYGGCGGIWFDQRELERVDGRAAANLHTVWRDPNKEINLTEPRLC